MPQRRTSSGPGPSRPRAGHLRFPGRRLTGNWSGPGAYHRCYSAGPPIVSAPLLPGRCSVGSRSGQCCQFHRDILHLNTIIAGVGGLVFLGEADRLLERSKEKIAQVHAAGTAQVCMGKAYQRRVFVPVARGGLPARIVRVRAQLDHAERRRGPGIGMAVASRADERIDTVHGRLRRNGRLLGFCPLPAGDDRQSQDQRK